MKKCLNELIIEKSYPMIVSIIVGILICIFKKNNSIPQGFENVINAFITFSSIILGFLGALLGIIFSVKDTDIMKYIFNYHNEEKDINYKNIFLNYFKSSIISGMLVIIIACFLFLDKHIPNIILSNYEIYTIKLLFIIWISVVTYFILSSYRIVNIIMKIIFKSSKSLKEPSSKKLEKEASDNLKMRCSKSKKDSN